MDNIRWIKALKKDPEHRKIIQTKEALINEDSFDPDEPLPAAVEKESFFEKAFKRSRTFFR